MQEMCGEATQLVFTFGIIKDSFFNITIQSRKEEALKYLEEFIDDINADDIKDDLDVMFFDIGNKFWEYCRTSLDSTGFKVSKLQPNVDTVIVLPLDEKVIDETMSLKEKIQIID